MIKVKASKIASLFIVMLLAVAIVNAQSGYSGAQITIPPSPTASSIINQIDESVQLYTGILNVNLPLYTLESRDISLPIALSYNGSGVRVDEAASWVGTNWTLVANGAITRTVKGLPDEFDANLNLPNGAKNVPAKGYLFPETRAHSGLNLLDYFNGTTNQNRTDLINFSNKTGAWTDKNSPKVWDTEPDEFNFSFGKFSGKFVFDHVGNICIIPNQNLKITKTITGKTVLGSESQRITAFEVIDDNGYKYIFGNPTVSNVANLTAVETTSYSTLMSMFRNGFAYVGTQNLTPHPGDPTLLWSVYLWSKTLSPVTENGAFSILKTYQKDWMTFTNTWYITRIESPTGDYVNFDYNSENYKYTLSHDYDIEQINLGVREEYPGFFVTYKNNRGMNDYGTTSGLLGITTSRHQPQTHVVTISYASVSGKRLSKITTAIGSTVDFIPDGQTRFDLTNSYWLKSIRVKNKSGILVKRFDLVCTYVQSEIEMYQYNSSLGANYSYNESIGPDPWANDYAPMFNDDHVRLFLNKVTEVSSSGEERPYQFFYDISLDLTNMRKLPRRMSRKKDTGGLYNGQMGEPIECQNPGDTEGEVYLGPQGEDFPGIFWNANQNKPWFLCAIREPNLNFATIGTLMEVIYPTGGKKKFTYSLSLDGDGRSTLKVDAIQSFPTLESQSPEITQYVYKNGGNLSYDYNYLYSVDRDIRFELYKTSKVFTSSNSIIPPNYTHGGAQGFGTVEVIQPGIGKTIYEYQSPNEISATRGSDYYFNKSTCSKCREFAIKPANYEDHQRGTLKKITVQDEMGRALSSTQYTYTINPEGFVPTSVYGMKAYRHELNGDYTLIAGFYKYTNDWVALTEQTNVIYDQQNPGDEAKKITSRTIFSYIPVHPPAAVAAPDFLVRKITQELPMGEKLITVNKYLNDYTVPTTNVPDVAAQGMVMLKRLNMTNSLIESVNYLLNSSGSYYTGGFVNRFKNNSTGTRVGLWENYKLKNIGYWFETHPWSTLTNNTFTFSNTKYKLASTISSYDSYMNPTSVTGENGIQSDYDWSALHNGGLLTSQIINPGSRQHGTYFEHLSLIGLAGITDPNGIVSSFEYDDFGRLMLTKDNNQDITARYRYKYKHEAMGITADFITRNAFAHVPVIFTPATFEKVGKTEYTWDFGDGTKTETFVGVVEHTYTQSGTYQVTLSKKNLELGNAIISKTISVRP
ncbi:MAG TPA: PKD domain-containing protein [Ohtaekwangia sp.]